MKLKLESCYTGTYNEHYVYAVLSADAKNLDNYSPECVSNWNNQVLPFIKTHFKSDEAKLGSFGFEDQGSPIALEFYLMNKGNNAFQQLERDLRSCIDNVNQQLEYKAKLRFHGQNSKDHTHELACSNAFNI